MIFLKGLMLGFLIAAPVGPIGVLCIQRTLNKGRRSGFVSGLGAATADALYGAVAAFGLVIVSNFLIEQQFVLRLVGGVFLMYIGIKTLLSKPKGADDTAPPTASIGADYVSTVFLTVTNPMTIISFAALFAGIGFLAGSAASASLLVAGVFLGSALWWLLLSFGVAWIGSKTKKISLGMVNRISGSVIIAFALLVLLKTLR